MKTKIYSITSVNLKLLITLPVIILLMVTISSCADRKKVVAVQSEIAPPPQSEQSENTSEVTEPEPFVVVEEMPMFPGGDAELLKYIFDNTNYPAAAKEKNIQGRVIIRFCVTKAGGVDRVTVIKGVDPELDAESIRVVNTLPRFMPGKQGGKPVDVWYMVPITFALN